MRKIHKQPRRKEKTSELSLSLLDEPADEDVLSRQHVSLSGARRSDGTIVDAEDNAIETPNNIENALELKVELKQGEFKENLLEPNPRVVDSVLRKKNDFPLLFARARERDRLQKNTSRYEQSFSRRTVDVPNSQNTLCFQGMMEISRVMPSTRTLTIADGDLQDAAYVYGTYPQAPVPEVYDCRREEALFVITDPSVIDDNLNQGQKVDHMSHAAILTTSFNNMSLAFALLRTKFAGVNWSSDVKIKQDAQVNIKVSRPCGMRVINNTSQIIRKYETFGIGVPLSDMKLHGGTAGVNISRCMLNAYYPDDRLREKVLAQPFRVTAFSLYKDWNVLQQHMTTVAQSSKQQTLTFIVDLLYDLGCFSLLRCLGFSAHALGVVVLTMLVGGNGFPNEDLKDLRQQWSVLLMSGLKTNTFIQKLNITKKKFSMTDMTAYVSEMLHLLSECLLHARNNMTCVLTESDLEPLQSARAIVF